MNGQRFFLCCFKHANIYAQPTESEKNNNNNNQVKCDEKRATRPPSRCICVSVSVYVNIKFLCWNNS